MIKRSFGWVLAGVMSAGLWCAPDALANGRFPKANQLVASPSDPSFVVARTTFGLLVSHDHGQTFAWVCESAIGVRDNEDPAIAILGASSVAVAGAFGLALSADSACDWALAGEAAGATPIDVAAERAHPEHAIALLNAAGGGPGATLLETLDSGAHWAPVGVPLPADLWAETADIAPSDGDRLYVSGTAVDGSSNQGMVMSSRDHGKTWSRTPIDLDGAASVFIGAVDPTNPDRVYLRTSTAAADALLVSDDGAASFRTVTTVTGSMLGLAVSPDGTKIAIGGPSVGVLVADSDALMFAPRSQSPIACLAWSPDGLFACGPSGTSGFVVGKSVDDGDTFTPSLAVLADIQGPLACGGREPIVQTCAADWRALAALFGADGGSPQAFDAGAETGATPSAAHSGCSVQASEASAGGAGTVLAASIGALVLWLYNLRRRCSPAGAAGLVALGPSGKRQSTGVSRRAIRE